MHKTTYSTCPPGQLIPRDRQSTTMGQLPGHLKEEQTHPCLIAGAMMASNPWRDAREAQTPAPFVMPRVTPGSITPLSTFRGRTGDEPRVDYSPVESTHPSCVTPRRTFPVSNPTLLTSTGDEPRVDYHGTPLSTPPIPAV